LALIRSLLFSNVAAVSTKNKTYENNAFSLVLHSLINGLFPPALLRQLLPLTNTPGKIPQIFALELFHWINSLNLSTFSPDGKEMFFSVVNSAWTAGKILHTREVMELDCS